MSKIINRVRERQARAAARMARREMLAICSQQIAAIFNSARALLNAMDATPVQVTAKRHPWWRFWA